MRIQYMAILPVSVDPALGSIRALGLFVLDS